MVKIGCTFYAYNYDEENGAFYIEHVVDNLCVYWNTNIDSQCLQYGCVSSHRLPQGTAVIAKLPSLA